MAEHDQDAAVEHAAVLADHAVGDDSTNNGCAPRRTRIRSVERGPLGVGEAEPAVGGRGDHVEQEERTHTVVAEAFPHLGEEERGQPTRMPEEARIQGRRRVLSDSAERVRKLGRIHLSKDNVEQWETVRVLLISTYDLGRQPLGLASPAAWLRKEGVEVECMDASRDTVSDAQIGAA